MALINKLQAIGEAIRNKTGQSELLTLDEMPAAIEGIQAGGGNKKTYQDMYFKAYTYTGAASDEWYMLIDTIDVSELKFKYDYIPSTPNNSQNDITLTVYYGYTLEPGNQNWTIKSNEDNSKTETLTSNLKTKVEGVENTLDVSNYSSIVIRGYIYKNSNQTGVIGTIGKFYDFELN